MPLHQRAAVVAAGLFVLAAPAAAQQACPPGNAGLTVPAGFCAMIVADSLGRARHFDIAANGDVFIAVLGRTGGVFALRDTTGDGVMDVRKRIIDAPRGASQVRLRTDPTGQYLYYSTEREIVRYRLPKGSLDVTGPPDTVAKDLPAGSEHSLKTFAFGRGDTMYVNIGVPSNSCQVKDRVAGSPGRDPCPLLDTAGGIWQFSASRSGQTEATGHRFATGLRNTVAITVRGSDGVPFGVMHGRDQLFQNWPAFYNDTAGAEKPAEEFVRLENGKDFGWPYCYYDPALRKNVLAPEYGGNGTKVGRCAAKATPIVAYPAHWAPDGLVFYEAGQFPASYRGGAFIAFHGSWNRAPLPQQGYKVVFQPFANGKPSGAYTVFADGFRHEGDTHRPVGLAVGPDGSLYVSDDAGGRLYCIRYQGR